MPPPGLSALGGGSMGPPNISAAGFSSALVAAAAAGNPGNMTAGAPGSMMGSHHALSASHPLSQSHLVITFFYTTFFKVGSHTESSFSTI